MTPTATKLRRVTDTARGIIATIIADRDRLLAMIINVEDVAVGGYYTD